MGMVPSEVGYLVETGRYPTQTGCCPVETVWCPTDRWVYPTGYATRSGGYPGGMGWGVGVGDVGWCRVGRVAWVGWGWVAWGGVDLVCWGRPHWSKEVGWAGGGVGEVGWQRWGGMGWGGFGPLAPTPLVGGGRRSGSLCSVAGGEGLVDPGEWVLHRHHQCGPGRAVPGREVGGVGGWEGWVGGAE